MKWALALLLLLLCASAMAAVETESVHITLNKNDVVAEQVDMLINADTTYDTVEYFSDRSPLAVIFNGTYDLKDQDNGTSVIFHQHLAAGKNSVSFTLLFDNTILSNGQSRTYSLHLEPESTAADVAVTLPEGFILANVSPAVSPKPDRIGSDGRSITLYWDKRNVLDLIVLYEAPWSPWPVIIAVLVVIAIAGIVVAIRRRKPDKQALHDTLSDDEMTVVTLIREGVTKQKELCARSGFSKSKMSKIARRLEEKNVVKKEPFFKTNKFELLAHWK